MAKTKKSPTAAMNLAAQRLAGTKSIEKSLDLGGGMTNAAYEAKIAAAQAALDEYNESLSVSDQKLNVFTALEKEVRDLNERMLGGVGSRYGKDSDEYEMAGGVRKSERKRRAPKPPGAPGK